MNVSYLRVTSSDEELLFVHRMADDDCPKRLKATMVDEERASGTLRGTSLNRRQFRTMIVADAQRCSSQAAGAPQLKSPCCSCQVPAILCRPPGINRCPLKIWNVFTPFKLRFARAVIRMGRTSLRRSARTTGRITRSKHGSTDPVLRSHYSAGRFRTWLATNLGGVDCSVRRVRFPNAFGPNDNCGLRRSKSEIC